MAAPHYITRRCKGITRSWSVRLSFKVPSLSRGEGPENVGLYFPSMLDDWVAGCTMFRPLALSAPYGVMN